MILRKYFLNRMIRRLIDESRFREHKYCSLDEATSILVLYCHEDGDSIKPMLDNLRSMNKELTCCVTSTENVDQKDSSVIYINKKTDTDKYGIPKPKIMDRIVKIPADILIDLSRNRCSTQKFIMLQHPSQLKVGERLADDFVYDFSIIMTDRGETVDLFGYLLFYLQTIPSK